MIKIEILSDNKKYSTKVRSMIAVCYVTKVKTDTTTKIVELKGEGDHSTKDQDYYDRVTVTFDSKELNQIFDEAIKAGFIDLSNYGISEDVERHLIEARKHLDYAISDIS